MQTRIRNVVAMAMTFSVSLLLAGPASGQIFTNLHSLVISNGTTPYAGLVLAGGRLYGTAENYGEQPFLPGNSGSVFRVNLDGSSFTNMHTFTQGADGGNPYGGVILAGSMLYGAAFFGGASNSGCIFGINTNGTGLTNLFSFPSLQPHSPFYTNTTGAYPNSGLIVSGATLYGMANGGGTDSWGTIFAVNTNGSGFTNLHNFNVTDGQYPSAALILSGSTLYGMTPDGGENRSGTIFKVSTNGLGYTNFYSFSAPAGSPYTNSDGASPLGSLLLLDGMLYGTASSGGSNACGTIFEVDTNGAVLTVLHCFSATNGAGINGDGAHPQAGLVMWSNVLYGTALDGGKSGYGTVFSLKADGTDFRTLYSFTSTNNAAGTNIDGAYPRGSLVLSGSVLYGTTSAGGGAGYGTIFSILFPPPLSIALAGTNVVLSWPSNVTGFNLQSATNLVASSWGAVSGQYSVTNPATGRQKYYRLMHP
jgi:uncharacterized repeat protein (TIGR03803 family)